MTLILISPLISRCSVDVSSLRPDSTQDVWLDLQEGSGRIHLLLTLSGFSDPAAAYAAQAAAKGGAGDPPEKGPAADGSDLVRNSIIFRERKWSLPCFSTSQNTYEHPRRKQKVAGLHWRKTLKEVDVIGHLEVKVRNNCISLFWRARRKQYSFL